MQLVLNEIEPEARIVISPQRPMTDDEFWDFCQNNPDLRFERTAKGEIEIMPPTGIETGYQNLDVGRQLANWAGRDARGMAFDSNTGFILPNGAARLPDACWVALSRLARLKPHQRSRFGPLCPDFVIEVTSPSDRLPKVHAKMREYMENGAKLGWLLHVAKRTIYIYRPDRDVEQLVAPKKLAGEGPVKGFVLDLKKIWDPPW